MQRARTIVIPQLETERLILNAPTLTDFDGYASIVTTERGIGIGGPLTREEAWLDLSQMVAGWIWRGYGALSIRSRDEGTYLGTIVVNHEHGDPEPELGWLLIREAEGMGVAYEAAVAMLQWAWSATELTTLVSYMDPANARAIALARRLGGQPTAGPDGVATYRYTPDV